MDRRLCTIVVADMVGYSRLMEADEVGTLRRQRQHRTELIDPTFERFRGNIIKTTGDGLIATFDSVVDAVQCLVEIQQAMEDREAGIGEDRRIRYRVGVNLGDLIIEEGDVFGDAVNIAARLEQMSEPGGICISGTAYDHLKSKVPVGYQSLGDVAVKNISVPVRAYAVLTDPDKLGQTISPKLFLTRSAGRIATLAVSLVVAAAVYAWWYSSPRVEPADVDKFAFELPDEPSVAVLPFTTTSSDSSDRYLADSFAEALLLGLAELSDLFVVGRASSFRYRDPEVEPRKVAEALGIRYVVNGSFARQDDQLRIQIRLIDAIRGQQFWSGRYDRPASEFYALQDELIETLVLEIGGRAGGGIFLAERERIVGLEVEDLTAVELWERATQEWLKHTPESNEKAKLLTEELIKRAPDYSRGYAGLAWTYQFRLMNGISGDRDKDSAECIGSARKAIERAPQDYMGHFVLSYCYTLSGDSKSGTLAMQRAYDLNPGDVFVLKDYARFVLPSKGQYEEAIDILNRALRLDPHQQLFVHQTLGDLYARTERFELAAEHYQLEVAQNISVRARAAASLQIIGESQRAGKMISELMEINPNYSAAAFTDAFNYFPEAVLARMSEALRTAGLPAAAQEKKAQDGG